MKKILLVLSLVIVCAVNVFAITADEFLEAAENGDIEIVQQYIDEGGDVNVQDDEGNTALMTVIIISTDIFRYSDTHTEIAKLLINTKANVNVTLSLNGNSMTIIDFAYVNGYTEIANLLKNAGAKSMFY